MGVGIDLLEAEVTASAQETTVVWARIEVGVIQSLDHGVLRLAARALELGFLGGGFGVLLNELVDLVDAVLAGIDGAAPIYVVVLFARLLGGAFAQDMQRVAASVSGLHPHVALATYEEHKPASLSFPAILLTCFEFLPASRMSTRSDMGRATW